MNSTHEIDFALLDYSGGNRIYADMDAGIIKVCWLGTVGENEARKILTHGADLIESGLCNKILLDRKDLTEFTTEARIWIKNDLLKSRARKLASQVERIATVNAASARGGIFSNFITSAIQLVYPKLKVAKFSNSDQATSWLFAT